MILYMDEDNVSGQGRSSRVPDNNGSEPVSVGLASVPTQMHGGSRLQLQPVVRLRRLEHFSSSVGRPSSNVSTHTLRSPKTCRTRKVKIKIKAGYECSQCQMTLSSKGTLEQHEKHHRRDKPHACRLCAKSFVRLSGLVRHMRAHTGEKPFSCPTCDKSFSCAYSVTLHRRVHTGEKPYVCDLCPKSFANSSNLAKHKRMHRGEKNFGCTLCNKTYTDRLGLDRHLRVIHTGEKPFRCLACAQRFYTNNELKFHRKKYHLDGRIPVNFRQHECDVCQKKLSTPRSLRIHKQLTHEKKPPAYTCHECGQKFQLPTYLRNHLKIHSEVKPEKCSFCPASFKYHLLLMSHIKRAHTREKPHSCTAADCNAQFCTLSETKAHQKQVHLRERHYKCPVCGQKFGMKGNLGQHILSHTGERRHVCLSCDKKFACSGSMKTHLRTHLGEKPYACSECGNRYTSSRNLKLHVAAVHDPVKLVFVSSL